MSRLLTQGRGVWDTEEVSQAMVGMREGASVAGGIEVNVASVVRALVGDAGCDGERMMPSDSKLCPESEGPLPVL